jgi:hypothetical protein
MKDRKTNVQISLRTSLIYLGKQSTKSLDLFMNKYRSTILFVVLLVNKTCLFLFSKTKKCFSCFLSDGFQPDFCLIQLIDYLYRTWNEVLHLSKKEDRSKFFILHKTLVTKRTVVSRKKKMVQLYCKPTSNKSKNYVVSHWTSCSCHDDIDPSATIDFFLGTWWQPITSWFPWLLKGKFFVL